MSTPILIEPWTIDLALPSPSPSPTIVPEPAPAPQAVPIVHRFAAKRVSDVPGSNVAPGDKVVALTFDDGPDPVFTPRVLDVLDHFQVSATFFMIGWEAAAAPDLVKRIAARGDGVANHTWSHVDLTHLSAGGLAAQVDRTTKLLSSLTGGNVTCIRPPEGHVNAGLVGRLADRGMTTVMWSADSRDWTRPGAAAITAHSLAGLSPGSIILLHDGGGDRRQTVEALPNIIAAIQAKGYEFVPLCR